MNVAFRSALLYSRWVLAGLLLWFAIVASRPLLKLCDSCTLQASDARPLALILVLVLGANLSVVALMALRSVTRHPWRGAWRQSLRSMGWYPLILLVAVVVLLVTDRLIPGLTTARILEVTLPLVIGVQAAFLFSPDDEPLLEVQIAAPRPMAWITAERVLTMLAVQGGIALIGTLLVISAMSDGTTLADLVVRWLPPALFMGGIGLSFTVSLRQPAFSLAMVVIGWLVLFNAREPALMMLPIMWPFDVFATPRSYEFALNRWVVTLIGMALIVRAIILASDPEKLLLNHTGQRTP